MCGGQDLATVAMMHGDTISCNADTDHLKQLSPDISCVRYTG